MPARATCCSGCLTGASNDAGLPYAWINLQHGLLDDDSTETNTAAAGSFTLELGLLSRLTGWQSEEFSCAPLSSGSKPDLPLGSFCANGASVQPAWLPEAWLFCSGMLMSNLCKE